MVGIKSWDDFLLRDAAGALFSVPTVPAIPEHLAREQPIPADQLEPDARLEGKQAIGGGGRGDATLSEETILTNTRPARSSTNPEPPLLGEGFKGWRITVVNPAGGAASGIKPEVWVVCVDAPTP